MMAARVAGLEGKAAGTALCFDLGAERRRLGRIGETACSNTPDAVAADFGALILRLTRGQDGQLLGQAVPFGTALGLGLECAELHRHSAGGGDGCRGRRARGGRWPGVG